VCAPAGSAENRLNLFDMKIQDTAFRILQVSLYTVLGRLAPRREVRTASFILSPVATGDGGDPSPSWLGPRRLGFVVFFHVATHHGPPPPTPRGDAPGKGIGASDGGADSYHHRKRRSLLTSLPARRAVLSFTAPRTYEVACTSCTTP